MSHLLEIVGQGRDTQLQLGEIVGDKTFCEGCTMNKLKIRCGKYSFLINKHIFRHLRLEIVSSD